MMLSFRSWPPVTRLAALSACLMAVACAVAPKPAPPVPPRAAIPIAPPQFNSGDSRFDAFLMQARKEALAEGVAPATFDRATAGLRPIPEIMNMNANQPEFARPVWAYLDTAVSARRVRDAQVMLDRYGAVLDRIEAQSGVPKEILVAIWGIETDYGAATGSYPLFAALATLAYSGPRADYARPEFLAALKIYQQQNYALSQMTGSWAGAFGQTQFTPTTFLKFAADGDGDGRIDLWNSPADALLARQGPLFARPAVPHRRRARHAVGQKSHGQGIAGGIVVFQDHAEIGKQQECRTLRAGGQVDSRVLGR